MATSPISTEIQVGAGGVGLGLNGQALTTATIGTLTTDPDLVVAAAGTLYTLPVAATNAITAFTATPQIIVCIQNVQ
jgi:hypothetical protein